MTESYQKISNHVDILKSLMLSQFRNSPYLNIIVSAIGNQIQDFENTMYDIISKVNNLDTAVAKQLDLIGVTIGRKRDGFSDDDYRDLLRLQVAINISRGSPEPISSTVKNITGSSFVYLQEDYPAGITFVVGESNINPSLLPLIEEVASSGVGVGINVVNDMGLEVFAFEGPPEDVFALGFGDVDDVLLGGKFSSFVNV